MYSVLSPVNTISRLRRAMPSFIMQNWNGYTMKIVPHDFIRRNIRLLLMNHDIIPYFYGPICFDLKIAIPKGKNKSEKIIRYKWVFCCSKDESFMKSGEGNIEFTHAKPYDPEKVKKGDVARLNKTLFRKVGAIDLGHVSIQDQYKVLVNFIDSAGDSSGDMIMAEFTLEDRDHYSLNMVSILFGALCGAFFGILGSILVFVFTAKN